MHHPAFLVVAAFFGVAAVVVFRRKTSWDRDPVGAFLELLIIVGLIIMMVMTTIQAFQP